MKEIEIAAYNFPQWHPDPRNDRWHGKGWTEWELLKKSVPRYEGHRQPVVPAWGYFDESDPAQSVREIDLAADHGLTAFIYDTYWYEDGPFLNGALDRGFLRAPNRKRLKFALMWANHNWHNWHPIRLADDAWKDHMLADGRVSREAFERFTDKMISDYFSQPNYLRLAEKLYFSIYDTANFTEGFGGIDKAAELLNAFRDKVRKSGCDELHLNAIVGRLGSSESPAQIVKMLGVDSVASYNWYDHYPIQKDTFPRGSYEKAMNANIAAWPVVGKAYGVPYIANVSTGWDSSPRCCPSDRYEMRGYPWLPILEGNSPEMFAKALRAMSDYFSVSKPAIPMFTINAWNEWTEGAYLLPDQWDGTGRLEMLKKVMAAG
jgi:hypothetical protein